MDPMVEGVATQKIATWSHDTQKNPDSLEPFSLQNQFLLKKLRVPNLTLSIWEKGYYTVPRCFLFKKDW